MPIITGQRGSVTINAVAFPGRAFTWAWRRSREALDYTAFNEPDNIERVISGIVGGSTSIEAWFDETAQAAITTIIDTEDDIGVVVELITRNTTGGKKYTGTVVITDHELVAEKRGLVRLRIEGRLASTITEAAVP